jgi:hypothetical protein
MRKIFGIEYDFWGYFCNFKQSNVIYIRGIVKYRCKIITKVYVHASLKTIISFQNICNFIIDVNDDILYI